MASDARLTLHPKQMQVFKSSKRFKVVVAGRRWGKCLHSDTLVSMADGSERRIEDVRAGELVLTVNEDTYALEPRRVQHVLDNGVKETVIVKTAARALRCTPNHPLLTNNRWVNAGEIKPGDLVAVPKRLAFGNAYLPIAHDDFIKHLTYAPVEKGQHGGYNYAVARDLPEELRVSLTSWRKQTSTRISTRRYEQLRCFSDGFYDPLWDADVAWEEVTAVEAAESAQTWDLTVEGNHNFIAEGIVTHNTQLSKVTIIKRAAAKPNQHVWYVAPTYRMAKQIMWQDLIDGLPPAWIKRVNETTMTIRLVNGSVIGLRGADKPDTLRGVGLHFLVLDEFQDMKPEVWTKVLRPTLASTGGHVLIIGTPKAFNHLYELYQLGQRGETYVNDKGVIKTNPWESWQFPTITSPFIPDEEVEAARRDMDEKSFRQEFEASFEAMSGRVYYAFDRRQHVGKYEFNPALPIWIGQDFNIDPMSSIVLQPQPNGEIWAVDEIVLYGSNTLEVCDEIERRYWRHLKQIIMYPDPAGGARQHARGETDLDIMREKGLKKIKYRRAHPPIADRVNAVNKMLMAADGTVRLRIDERCRNFINSLEQTMYKPGGRDIDKSANIEHITDAAGYCIELEFPVRRIEVAGLSI